MIDLTKKTKFISAIVFQLIVIFTIIIFKVSVSIGGFDVLLEIEPVDPRDPFRGDYLTFRYSDLSIIDLTNFDFAPVEVGGTVYVPLVKSAKYWTAQRGIEKNRSEVDGSKLFIKGKVTDVRGSSVSLTYGIEEYFIPEGTGRDFSFFSREAHSKVAIDQNGNPVLKNVYVDDKPFEEIK